MATDSQQYASPSGARKRKCNPEDWERNKTKRACQTGQSYVSTHTGNEVAARTIGPPCKCTQKCFTVIGDEHIARIHHDFWCLGDHTLQTAFIQNCAKDNVVKNHYTDNVMRQQAIRRSYHLLKMISMIGRS